MNFRISYEIAAYDQMDAGAVPDGDSNRQVKKNRKRHYAISSHRFIRTFITKPG